MRSPTPTAARAITRVLIAAFLVLSSANLSSCGQRAQGGRGAGGPGKGGGGFQMPPMPVEVASVRPERVRQQFRALANVEADESIEVTSQVSSVVKSLPFGEGQRVAAGALLARLDDSEELAAAQRATAEREQAEANAGRAEKLAEQHVISQAELDDVRSQLKVAQANEAEALAKLEKTRIRAPWAGIAGRRRVSPGAYVRPGDVITEVARVGEVKVRFAAPERYATELLRGVPVEATAPAYPGEVFTGRVSVVDPIVDPETRTVQIVARLPNPKGKLKPGMSANVSVTLSERPAALVVPDEAIFAEGSQHYVFVVRADSTVARTAVQTGLRDSARVEVIAGLTAGQQVVSAGHQKLFDGARVMPIPSGAMGTPGGAPGEAGSGEAAHSNKAGKS